jgi:hypothetical protein
LSARGLVKSHRLVSANRYGQIDDQRFVEDPGGRHRILGHLALVASVHSGPQWRFRVYHENVARDAGIAFLYIPDMLSGSEERAYLPPSLDTSLLVHACFFKSS